MKSDFFKSIKDELSNIKENDNLLISVINENIQEWDNFLLIGCKLTKENYSKKIYLILKNAGFEFENEGQAVKKINVYLSRARNKK